MPWVATDVEPSRQGLPLPSSLAWGLAKQLTSGRPIALRLPASILLATALFALSGCGGGDEDDGRMDVSDFVSARESHDPLHYEEVDLGAFQLNRLVQDNQTMHLRFHLYAVVHSDDVADFKEKFEARGHIMRDAIITTINATDVEHLNHPGLDWVRSLLVLEIKRALQTRDLRNVVVTEFELEEPPLLIDDEPAATTDEAS